MIRLLLSLALTILVTSCGTYNDPITIKQKEKKKTFQTKSLKKHDLTGHVKTCDTEIYDYTKATEPDYKAPDGAYILARKGAHTFPDTPSYKEHIEFSKDGSLLKINSKGLGIGSDDFLASLNNEDREKLLTLKDAKKSFDDKGNCTTESTNDVTISYIYDSTGNCKQRKIVYNNSKFREFTTQTYNYDSLGNWIHRTTLNKYKAEAVTNPYTEQKILRTVTYWTSEELGK